MDLDDEELEATRKLHNRKEKIKVGEYGRTNTGKIFIFAWLEYEKGKIDERKVLLGDGKKILNEFYYFKENEKIIKHSSNIIDLIEEGDYVNGEYVLKAAPEDKRKRQVIIVETARNEFGEDELENKDIKSIVTKEQFNRVKYEV